MGHLATTNILQFKPSNLSLYSYMQRLFWCLDLQTSKTAKPALGRYCVYLECLIAYEFTITSLIVHVFVGKMI